MTQTKQTPKFSDFGLDDVKRSRDKSTTGQLFCCWGDTKNENIGGYGHDVAKGFNICFANFCICAECIRKSYLDENSHRWILDPFQCFKCKKKGLVCYQQYDSIKNPGLGLCRECMDWAAKVLELEIVKPIPKSIKNDRPRQAQQSLFPDQEF